ncbi:MAG: hypothetical protein AAF702_33065 [Chloroflexota bacterium]
MDENTPLAELIKLLAHDVSQLCSSGTTWKIILHGGRDGGIKVEKTTYTSISPPAKRLPPAPTE